ncbi:MAG: hypothetical protein ABI137_13595, partial [Antricoccus sp.]
AGGTAAQMSMDFVDPDFAVAVDAALEVPDPVAVSAFVAVVELLVLSPPVPQAVSVAVRAKARTAAGN